jgi:acyl-CoA synthetase (AMP-forming)/AMP-acid ligase II
MADAAGTLSGITQTLSVLWRSGLIRPNRPDRMVAAVKGLRRYGTTAAGGFAATAARHPMRIALVDERGPLSYREVEARSNALCRGLQRMGVGSRDRVGLLCRDHRGFVETMLALSKIGADVVYMNTSFAGPQLTDVAEREGVVALVYDDEFESLAAGVAERVQRILAWHDGEPGATTLEQVLAGEDTSPLPAPDRVGNIVILTSGTTGTPKGAQRSGATSGLPALVAMLSKIPLRGGGTTVIAAPLFHSWGLAHLMMGIALGSTMIVQRRFDPENTLQLLARHRADALVVVPVMLQRILDLPEDVRSRYDTSSLRVVASSGSALPGELSSHFMDAYGDVIYNLYGSTEVSWATIATPEDLRAAPGTAGQPPLGTTIKLFDEAGNEVPQGETGRIFVSSSMPFEGYTGGGSKEVIEGMMSTGDVGRWDEAGRLFVEGRDDDMIVSGGENLFPREVEDLLVEHPGVADVAIVGVPDEQFGQRLKAFVVRSEGSTIDEDGVKTHVRENLARFKVPRDVVFVDELPRNPTGKVLKRELRDR